jgi:hypothetical protein
MKKERSRAYPVLDLETAFGILIGKLSQFRDTRLDRDALAETLGYSSAGGGIAARKVSALVQYGMIDSRDGLYELSARGHRLQRFKPGTEDFLNAARLALEKPSLFRSLLTRYRPQGRIPEDLARVLTEHYGITERASEDAEGVFIRSAVFAGVLDAEGRFREIAKNRVRPAREVGVAPPPQPEGGEKSSFPIPLTGQREAGLDFPPDMSARDLEILEARLRFEIESGTLWAYLGLTKQPTSIPAHSAGETQEPGKPGTVPRIRKFPKQS